MVGKCANYRIFEIQKSYLDNRWTVGCLWLPCPGNRFLIPVAVCF